MNEKMDKKRVLIFSLAYYPNHMSGAEFAVKEITDRISTGEIEFHMMTHRFSRKDKKQEQIGNVMVHRVGFGDTYASKICFIPLAAYAARKLHREVPFDALWALMTYMLFPIVLARVLGVRLPYVLTLQDGDTYETVFKRWFVRPFVPLLDFGIRRAAVIQAISTYLSAWPKRRGYSGKVVTIPNGADPYDLDPNCFSTAEVQETQAQIGKKEGDIFLINTARLVHQKAFDVTIQALTFLPEAIKFLIVGSGFEEVKLRALVTKLGLESRVVFVGHTNMRNAALYRRAADIFVMPSRSEGLGSAGLSAMAAELPLIATQVGGLSEYVFDETHGESSPPTAWVVRPDAPEEIAAAVSAILEHPEKARERTKNARALIQEKYTWDLVGARMKTEVFDEVFDHESDK